VGWVKCVLCIVIACLSMIENIRAGRLRGIITRLNTYAVEMEDTVQTVYPDNSS
jgi:hypothetical protein